MNTQFFLTLLMQALVLLSTAGFCISMALKPLSPSSKRLGYVFMIPVFILGIVRYFYPAKDSASLFLIASYAFPLILLLLTILKHSFQKDRQVLFMTIFFTLILFYAQSNFRDSILKALGSPVVLTLFVALHIVLLVLIRKNERKDQWVALCFFLLGNLIIVYKNIGDLRFLGYAALCTGYGISLLSFHRDHIDLTSQILAEQKELKADFRQAVEREVRKQTRRVEWAKEQIKEKSKFDSLTGALSKKPLLELIDSYIHSQQMQKFSILMFDIDNFKGLNDTHGHIVGDKCLKDLVSIAISTLRQDDAIGRYGGDEFFIVLPDQTAGQAMKIANRYRENIMDKTDPSYSISIGISSYPWDGKSHKELIHVADEGLYKSKENGRNQVSYTGYLNVEHEFS